MEHTGGGWALLIASISVMLNLHELQAPGFSRNWPDRAGLQRIRIRLFKITADFFLFRKRLFYLIGDC